MMGLIEEKVSGGFETSLEHLLAELQRIDLKLRLRVLETRLADDGRAVDEFRGLYVSEEEVDAIVASAFPLLTDDGAADLSNSTLGHIIDSLRQLEAQIAKRKSESLRNGVMLRLLRLSELYHLSEFELDALLVCLLPEMKLKYERLYAYLQDDVTKKRPSIDLVLRLLCPSVQQRLAARKAFSPQAPLVKYHLLRVGDELPTAPGSFLSKLLKVDERIVDYLLGSDRIDARLLPFAELVTPCVQWDALIVPDEFKNQLRHLLSQGDGDMVCYLQGPHGVGRRTAAEALCRESGIQLLVINVGQLLVAEIPIEVAAELVLREGGLQDVAIYWGRFDLLLSESNSVANTIIDRIAGWSGLTLLSGEAQWIVKGWRGNKPFVCIEFPFPSHTLRKRLWQAHLDGVGPQDIDLSTLADKFRFTAGQIHDAVVAARNLAVRQGREDEQVNLDDLYQACRTQSNQNLSTLARKIQPKYTWADIVLPRDQMAQMREICGQVKYHHVVFEEWNFDSKISLGRGLNVLFAGPSGTGKTMASEIMAGELGLDLYKVDLSAIVSKYIGETEKNLDKIFKEGRDSNAILLFDEADALFGKRSEVRDSHDRYANIEVAYLLQKMEEYEGIVILATNLRKNVDEAFARRMHFSVEFPFPEEPDRYQIWQRIFPPEAPLDEDVALAFLARQFKITGGNIKNIAMTAAFLAATDSRIITMEYVIRGTKREYQKIGKLCTETDFAQYYDLVKG